MRISLLVLVIISLLLFSGVAAAEGKWMIAKNTLSSGEGRPASQPTEYSVSIWNASYSKGETVEWFGSKKYSQQLVGFVASDEGRAVWHLIKESENITRVFKVKQQEMDILNNSPYYITALFVCPANSDDWQEVLGGRELRSGKQRKVIFNLVNSVHRWDIKVVDSSGCFTVFQNQWIKEDFTSINYYYKDGTGHIRFAVG